MSSTFQYLVVRNGPEGRAIDRAAAALPGAVAGQDLAGWTALSPCDLLEMSELARIVAMSSQSGSLALGIYVELSDFGYCVGASDGAVAFHVVLNEQGTLDSLSGGWAVEQCRSMAGSTAWKEAAAARVQRWAREVPESLMVENVLVFLNRYWIFPEDAVAEFVELVGIPPVNVSALMDRCREQSTKPVDGG